MKKIILFVLIFTFSYSPVILSIINPIDKTIEFKKNKLCKTWYVAKAFDLREDRPRKDRTKQAGGSTFTFNNDNSFILTDNSRGSQKPMEGTWKETKKNSFTINMEDIALNFEIKKLTRDSLYIIGSEVRRGNRKMHIVFSSSYVKPYDRPTTEIQEIREYEEMELSEDIEVEKPEMEIEEEEIMEEVVKEISVKVKGPKYDINKLPKTWILIKYYTGGKNRSEETIGTSFIFNSDNTFELIEFHKKNNSPEFGRWEIKYDKLEITINNKTTSYEISFLSDINLTIKDLESENYTTYIFKAQQ